jgi:allene oxide cyclase-like protein
MQRTFALSAAVAVLLAGGAVTLAGATSPAGAGKRFHVIHVTRDTGQDIYLDLDHSVPPNKPVTPDSVGDEDVYAANLYVGGRKVGSDGGVCKLVRLPGIYHCVATNSLPEGDLTVQFLADYTQAAPGRFAITGGTGRYRGASGEVTYVDNPDPQQDVAVYRFTTH